MAVPAPSPAMMSGAGSSLTPPQVHALAVAHTIAQQTGLDINNPEHAAAITNSQPFKDAVAGGPPPVQPSDVGVPDRAASATPGRFDWSQDPTAAEQDAYTAKDAALVGAQNAEAPLQAELPQAVADAAKMANFNRSVYTEQRLAEMDPTSDIDKAILAVRQKALYDRANMWEQMQGMNPADILSAIQNRENEYTSQLKDLDNLRTARLNDAKQKISDEIDSYTGESNAAKTKVDAIKAAIDAAKASGADEASIAQLHIDMAQANKKLQKARAGTGGLGTDGDLAYQSLVTSYRNVTGKDPTTKAEKDELKKMAQGIATGDPTLLNEIQTGQTKRTTTPAATGGINIPFVGRVFGTQPADVQSDDVDTYLARNLTPAQKLAAINFRAKAKKAGIQ